MLDFLFEWWPFLLVGLVAGFYPLSGLVVVQEWERVPVMRFGKYVRTLGPGMCWLEPVTQRTLEAVDTRQEVMNFDMDEGKSLQTHDNVPIAFETVITQQVVDVKKFTLGVTAADDAVEMRGLSTVSEVVSGTELVDLLHNRAAVCARIRELLAARVADYGVAIVAVELRDVKIVDASIQEAIAMKARAAKEAEAEMVRAEAQVAIARELNLAAAELNEGGWRLKGMEVMTELTRSAENNTIVIPSDIVQGLARFSSFNTNFKS